MLFRLYWRIGAYRFGTTARFPAIMQAALSHASEDCGVNLVPASYASRFFGPAMQRWVPALLLDDHLSDQVGSAETVIAFNSRFVDQGDWSGVIYRGRDTFVHRSIAELVVHRHAFRTMPTYAEAMAKASAGHPYDYNRVQLNEASSIDAYFARNLAIIEDMAAHGYKSRAMQPVDTLKLRSRDVEWAERDIGVAIGPDGTLLRIHAGRHRLAIAQALGIDRVAVEVRLVHLEWLRTLTRRSGRPPCEALVAWLESRGWTAAGT